jgi:hypothetical protein
MEALKWLLENQLALLALAYGLLNVVNGVLNLIPGDQGESFLGKVRSVLDRVSLLTAKDGKNTLKLPLSKSKK